MRPGKRAVQAFCTVLLVLASILAVHVPIAFAAEANLSRHVDQELRAGAVSLPLDAEVEYAAALDDIGHGKLDDAKKHLQSSIALAPHFTDSYFTLARLEARRLSPDAIFWLVQGVVVTTRSFEAQSLFLANAGVAIMLIFLITSGIVWLALALRYFPFLAHRIAEWLSRRLNAAKPRACAYLILFAPFLVIPAYPIAIALVMLTVWPFMQRRERVVAFMSAAMFALLAWFAPWIDRYSPIADPLSLTSLIAQANESSADPTLAALIQATPSRGLDAEKQTALGLLAMRAGQQEQAVGYFLGAVEKNPQNSLPYVNIGNVYYLNGQYDKALEGYRKAEQVNATDAVGQHNEAQAYIKTLLMDESSQALKRSSQAGFDAIHDSFAERARDTWSIFPRIYGAEDFWRMAAVEGQHEHSAVMTSSLRSATGVSPRLGFVLVVAALLLSLIGAKFIKPLKVAFQCSNCGEITCNGCCSDAHGTILCRACGKVVGGVTSDKVLEALLRQRRQQVIVKRRKSIKWLTLWVPGVRHLFYGRMVSGVTVATLFAGCLVSFFATGYILPRWSSLDYSTPLWQWILPALGVILSYTIAVTSRQLYEMRSTRSVSRSRASENADDNAASA
ncbi:MAG TPA: tetratricopeptide repeat protein [Candidatus Krumholzibacteria bacterium]|nr:tetratricopeptide repeat protein [Candidatus Krumholzibacteria bacterium]